MGGCLNCSQTEGDRQNNTVQRQIERDRKQFNKVKKILFLGSGGSGKSTIFKQLRGIYGKGFNAQERHTFVSHIHEQCITQMKLALEVLEDYLNGDMDNLIHQLERQYIDHNINQESKDDDEEYDEGEIPDLTEPALEAKEFLTSIHYTHYTLNDEIVAALKTLWEEPAIQKIYEMRNITKIEDSSAYFWNKLDQLNQPNYVPDEADILLVRYRTTGATEEKYEMPDNKGSFSIIDVGGQKSERKKWIKCFDSVTAVIFVASLSCYDEVLYEDYSTNSMTDQLQLFDDICNNTALAETSMILFLNKRDLFTDKIKHVPLQKCASFRAYSGNPTSFDSTTKYIRKAFTSLNNEPNKKNIFTHITCATDQDNIQKVFADVQHIVIEASLIQAGLMDWDDNQRYRSVENTDDGAYDPETAKIIRSTIQASNRQKSIYQQQQYPYMMSMPTFNGSNMKRHSSYNNSFREIIKKKSIPQLESIEYASILTQYKYNMDNRVNNIIKFNDDDNKYLNCKYCWAQSKNDTFILLDIEPNTNRHSMIKRKKVNLTIVLDIGKSMATEFTDGKIKMGETKKCLIQVIKSLNNDDRFSLIVFDMKAKVIQEIESIDKIDINELCEKIEDIQCETTSLESVRVGTSGFKFGVSQYRKLWTQKKISQEYENRIIMITTSRLSDKTLNEAQEISKNDQIGKRVYSTFIGISNRFLAQRTNMYEIKGCNYFSINSSEQLQDKLVTRFDEITCPLMFNLNISLKSGDNDQCIDSIYRLNNDLWDEEYRYAPKRDKARILHINTLFLTKQSFEDDDENAINHKYLFLIKLSQKIDDNYNFEILIQYDSNQLSQRNETISNSKTISLQRNISSSNEEYKEDGLLNGYNGQQNNNNNNDYYDNNSIRKAILLQRYVSILREWVSFTKSNINNNKNGGYVAPEYKNKFQQFTKYFQTEVNILNNDKELNKEINVLQSLFT